MDDDSARQSVARSFDCAPAEVLAAGAPHTPEEDRETVRKAAAVSEGGGVIVLVRAWEPPLEEFLDFLGELRSGLPSAAPVIVAAVGVGEDLLPSPPTGFQMEAWRRTLAALGDPWLSVRPLVEAP